MKELRIIGKNITMIFCARIFDLLASLLIIAILTRHLGLELYGKYSFIMALVLTITSFSHMGIPKILVREISRNKSMASHYLGSSLIFTAFTFIFVLVLGISVSTYLGLDKILVICLGIAIFAEILNIFSGSFISVFIAFERMGFDALTTALHRILLFSLLAIVFLFKLDFIYIFFSTLVAFAGGLIFSAAICVKVFSVRPAFENWKNNLKYLVIEVLPVGLSFIILLIYQYLDVFIVKFLRGFTEVALFQAPYSLILKCQFLPRILVISLAPLLSRLAFLDTSYRKLSFLFIRIFKYLAVISLPFSLMGYVFSADIVLLFFGRDFADSAVAFSILVCTIPLMFMDSFTDVALVSIGKQRVTVLTTVVSLVINLVLAVIFVRSHGFVGAAIAFFISFVCLFGLNFYFLSRYVGGLSFLDAFLLPGAACLTSSIPIIISNRFNAVTALITALIIYLGIIFIFKVFSREELFRISTILDQARNVGRQ